jgi:uncharacterized repeat protein (TIGR02543 family)
MSGFGTGSNSYGQFWFGGNTFPGFLYKKNVGVAGRRSTKFNPGGNITCNSETYLYNKYKPGGGGVGASSTSNRRAKNRLATVCSGQQCFPCFNTLGQYSNYTHNPNGFVPCPAITSNSSNTSGGSVIPTPTPPTPPPGPSGTYIVTYLGNGNTGGTVPVDSNSPYAGGSPVTILTNTSITTFQPTFIKGGYTFGGWNTAPDGSGTNYIGGNTFTINANTTLYANWIGGGNIGLFYRAGTGGTGTPPPSSGTYYNAYTLQPIVDNTGSFTRTGFTFGGWNTSTNGSGTSYPAGSTITIPGSTTILFAQWIPNGGPNVNLTYNANSANGGIGTDVINSYSTNSAATISPNPSFTNTDPNKIFYAWNTAIDGSGTSYPAGSYITMNSSKTLYAQWVSNTSPNLVTYEPNGATSGSVPASPTFYPSGVQVPILGQSSLTRPGYTFLGWNGSDDGTGSVYAPGYTFISKPTTLYALWAPGSPVKNCGGGGTGGTAGLASIFYFFPFAQIIQSSDTITIYTTALLSASSSNYGTGTAPLGITSIASMTIIKSSTIKINTNTSFLNPVNDNYYSKIITNGIDSNYWPLGATISNITYSAVENRDSSIPTYNTSTRFCNSLGCGLSANVGSNNGVITGYSFYNQCFTINFSTGPSTFIANSPTNVLYTASTSLPLNWVSAPKNRYPYGDVLDTSGNVQSSYDALTAITIIPLGGSTYISPAIPNYTLQFDGNGANQISATTAQPYNATSGGSIPSPTYFAPYNSSGPTSVAVGGNTGALTRTNTATLNEFVFRGWNTSADGSGTNYGPNSPAPLYPSNNPTYSTTSVTNILYANWTQGYYVRYSNNLPLNASGTSGSVTDTSSPYLPLNPSTSSPYIITVKSNVGGFTWTGHTLLSWNTAANGTGISYLPPFGQTFPLTANVMLYAQWSP